MIRVVVVHAVLQSAVGVGMFEVPTAWPRGVVLGAIGMVALASHAIWYSGLALPAQVGLSVLLCAYLYGVARDRLHARPDYLRLQSGRCWLCWPDGRVVEVVCVGEQWVHARVALLRLRSLERSGICSLLLCLQDDVDEADEAFRQLRIWVRGNVFADQITGGLQKL